MGEPKQPTMQNPLLYQESQGHSRQGAIIGLSIMSLSTLVAHVLIQNSSSTPQRLTSRAGAALILGVAILAMCAWVCGIIVWFVSFGGDPRAITARNKALIYAFGAANVSLTAMIIWPGIDGRLYFAFTILPAYIGMAVGSLL